LGSLDEAQIAPGEPSEETLEQCVEIFGTFSNMDSLRIFMYAEKGISSSTKAIKDLGLTPKRYYSRLKGLVEAGILEKTSGSYVYTPIGEVLSRLGESLIGLVRNRERIELLLNLSKAEVLSPYERDKINTLILENSDISNLIGPVIGSIPSSGVKKITNYDDLVNALIKELGTVKESFLLATTYFDSRVMDAGLKVMNKVPTRVLMSKNTMGKKMNKLRLLLSPKMMINILEFSSKGSELSETYREADIPFSFCILDGCKCFFELPSLFESEFSIAFYVVDESTSKRFSNYFEQLWKNSEPQSSFTFFNKSKDS